MKEQPHVLRYERWKGATWALGKLSKTYRGEVRPAKNDTVLIIFPSGHQQQLSRRDAAMLARRLEQMLHTTSRY